MQKIETIIEMMQSCRSLTQYYLTQLSNVDHHKVFEVEGKKLNSVHWILSHLCWTDEFLLIQSSKNNIQIRQDWFEEYGYGSDPNAVKTKVPYAELLELLNSNRATIINYLSTLTDTQLDDDNALNMSMGGSKALKNLLYHSIRHEGIHAGHLSWLCKLHGLKTV